METLNQILAAQLKLIGKAKKTLEETRKKPPSTSGPIAGRKATVAELKARVTNLTAAKADAVQQFDEQIKVYEQEIAVLERQIQEDKKQQGNQPSTPRPRGRGVKS